MISVVKCADEEKLGAVNTSQLLSLLDKLMQGGDLSSLPAPVAAIVPAAEAKSQVEEKNVEEEKFTPFTSDSVKSMDASMIIAAGKKYKEIIEGQKKDEKLAQEDELKRISFVYNEEKQKLDLTMKIQQARQRQSLQRKLFEKKNSKQSSGP